MLKTEVLNEGIFPGEKFCRAYYVWFYICSLRQEIHSLFSSQAQYRYLMTLASQEMDERFRRLHGFWVCWLSDPSPSFLCPALYGRRLTSVGSIPSLLSIAASGRLWWKMEVLGRRDKPGYFSLLVCFGWSLQELLYLLYSCSFLRVTLRPSWASFLCPVAW